ncbi:uncharacterized protein Dvar_56340 [Desulfosarcina variabilis str. Montpellier]
MGPRTIGKNGETIKHNDHQYDIVPIQNLDGHDLESIKKAAMPYTSTLLLSNKGIHGVRNVIHMVRNCAAIVKRD